MDFTTDFAPYVGLAFILYALRQTKTVPNTYIPIAAILLGVPFSFWENGGFTPEAFVQGLQYALLGIGTVAGIKYFLERKREEQL